MNAEIEKLNKEIDTLEKKVERLQKKCKHKYVKSHEYFTDYEFRYAYTCSECGMTKSEFVCDAPRL